MARELLGKQQPEYDYLPYFYSRIYDLGWEVRCMLIFIGIYLLPEAEPPEAEPPRSLPCKLNHRLHANASGARHRCTNWCCRAVCRVLSCTARQLR